MRYCKLCVTPETHPLVRMEESGVCTACQSHATRADVDWVSRERLFREVVAYAKENSRGYDCLIPVSGGKDSYWQVVTCREYGLNPLTVTWRDPMRLPIGQENLEHLVGIGVDHLDYTINPRVEKRFLHKSVQKYGVPGIPKHMALYNIPLRLAVKLGIPLIVWGENDSIEYGNLDDRSRGFEVDYEWLRQHGVTQGTTAADWVDADLSEKDLTPYFGPTEEELSRQEVRAVYLGYYFPWDPVRTYEIAREHGFRAPEKGPGYYTFDDVDSGFISIHHYIKWYKFGYTRLFDNLSLEIRNGRITREEAVDVIRQRGPETPEEDIAAFCEFLGISVRDFFAMCEKFRNRDIWEQRDGRWVIPDFIVPDWNGWETVRPG